MPLQSLTQIPAMNYKSEKYGTLWSKEELTLCFYLYCQIPFSRTNRSNPEVVKLANLIGRTIGSVVRKLGNFGAFDERLAKKGVVGLVHYSKADKQIWEQYFNNWDELVSDSQSLLVNFKAEKYLEKETEIPIISSPPITEKQATVKIRIGQSFFRKTVLSSYDNKCCICQNDLTQLLIASHIIPWSENKKKRIDPKNGLSLCMLHDKAFDKGLVGFKDDFRITVSSFVKKSKSEFVQQAITDFENSSLILPFRFLPSPENLLWHQRNIFIK